MRVLVLIIALTAGGSGVAGAAAPHERPDPVARAEALAAEAQTRFEVGLVAITDVIEAEYYVLEARHAAGVLDTGAFCAEAQAKLPDVIAGITAAYDVGARTMTDVVRYLAKDDALADLCAGAQP